MILHEEKNWNVGKFRRPKGGEMGSAQHASSKIYSSQFTASLFFLQSCCDNNLKHSGTFLPSLEKLLSSLLHFVSRVYPCKLAPVRSITRKRESRFGSPEKSLHSPWRKSIPVFWATLFSSNRVSRSPLFGWISCLKNSIHFSLSLPTEFDRRHPSVSFLYNVLKETSLSVCHTSLGTSLVVYVCKFLCLCVPRKSVVRPSFWREKNTGPHAALCTMERTPKLRLCSEDKICTEFMPFTRVYVCVSVYSIIIVWIGKFARTETTN